MCATRRLCACLLVPFSRNYERHNVSTMREIAHPTDAWRLTYVRIELNIISHRIAFRCSSTASIQCQHLYFNVILMARFGIYDFVAAMRHVSRANYSFFFASLSLPCPQTECDATRKNAPCGHFRMKFLSAMPSVA